MRKRQEAFSNDRFGLKNPFAFNFLSSSNSNELNLSKSELNNLATNKTHGSLTNKPKTAAYAEA